MMKLFIVVLFSLFFVSVFSTPLGDEQYQFLFTRFIEKFEKQYETNDVFHRFQIYKNNLNKIISHNSQENTPRWTMAVNKFADLTEVEFVKLMKFGSTSTIVPTSSSPPQSKLRQFDYHNIKYFPTTPEYIDWRTQGVVNAIKDQGHCGSCYAFSTTQSLESINAIKTGKLLDFSEQQLVDCSDMMGNAGCDGGLMSNAFDYLVSNNGACLSTDYPYRGTDSPICTKCKPAVKVKGYTAVQAGNDNLAKALVQNGPIAVALAATDKMQFYNSGVFDECVTDVGLNHAVGLVGVVGADETLKTDGDAWVIRNSWGQNWGSQGYFYMDFKQEDCLKMSVTSSSKKWNVFPTL